MTLYPEDIERYGQPTDEPTEADPPETDLAERLRAAARSSATAVECTLLNEAADELDQMLGIAARAYEEATDLRAVLVGLIQAIDGVARGEWGIDDIKADRAAAERALVGGRSAAPTREQVAEAIGRGTRSTDRITERFISQATNRVVALLSRPAAEPPEGERTLAEARSLMRTARSLDPTKPVNRELLGQVFDDLIDLLAPDGVAAEPNEGHGDGA